MAKNPNIDDDFCLGIFIFPKQNFISTSETSDCCKTEKIVVANLKKNLVTVKKMTKNLVKEIAQIAISCCSTLVLI